MSTLTFPIVGIGASAGGLDALKTLFRTLPTDCGAAFVVIQHLDPKHASLTAEILRRSTAMPTVQSTDGMLVEPNHVYVIPPNAYLTLHGHTLQLSEPVLLHGLRMPIDAFLWSLAEQHNERAIAIIVSGTGSDGTLGLRAVKGNGGIVLAQSPGSAEYDGMPRSAIATGLVDVVCRVDEMPEYLIRYLQHPYVEQTNSAASAVAGPEDAAENLKTILSVLRTRIGYDFRAYKKGTIERRITRRMGLLHLGTLTEYLACLREQEHEAGLLFKDLLIGVTAFFRDPEAFEALRAEVIVPLVDAKQTDDPIRVWVPGCASGEEAYSIAILLLEQIEAARKHCPLQVFASDVDGSALDAARAGIYPENVAVHLSPQRLRLFFSKEDHSYRINKPLRDNVTFASQNLISDPPFSNLDLISCRNLLIYLNAEAQRRTLALMHFALRDNGCLFLGYSESVAQQDELFMPVVKKWGIHRRVNTARPMKIDFPIGSRAAVVPDAFAQRGAAEQLRLRDIAHKQLLQDYAPAAVLVNSKRQVLYFFGPSARYLEQPSGEPTQDLLSLAHHELRAKVHIGLRRAIEEDRRVSVDDAHVTRGRVRVRVKMTFSPLMIARFSEPLFLVTFEDQPAELSPREANDSARTGPEASLVQQMEDELNVAREDLQSNIEELESTNEELQVANEEVMSANEELQSTNEEMETSREELQSMNEELTTVNSQLKDKVEELAQTNNDLANLFSSTEIATVFLDNDLKIGRFTPTSKRLLNLIASDVGRPLSDIRPNLVDPTLFDDAQRVLDSRAPLETEVSTADGSCYLRRILPYRTGDDRIAGVAITFIDISERKRAEEQTRRLAAVVHDSNDAIELLDLRSNIIAWNHGAEQMYGWSEHEALSMSLQDLVPQAQREATMKLFQRIAGGEIVRTDETRRLTKDGRVLDVLLTVTPLRDEHKTVIAIATTERDISERKRADAAIRRAKNVADQALATKSRFLATASHDLRQPLQALSLLNQALLKSSNDPKTKKLLKMQGESLSAMSRLLNSLLDISKLESGTVTVNKSSITVASIFDQIRAEFEGMAREKGLALRIEEGAGIVFSDRELLAQLLQNLVANAIRYTRTGFVQLSCAHEDGSLRIEVKDSGIGIAANQLSRIFDEFYQVARDPQEHQESLGLGLSIVRRIARLLDTEINVQSEVGHGSTFSFTMPVGERALSEVIESAAIGERSIIERGSILLVDDDRAVLDALRITLAMEPGFEITTASSPSQAHAVLDSLTPDLIITDFHLGDTQTGVDIVRAARARAGRPIPAILVTGDTSLPIDAAELQDIQTMTKPVVPQDLVDLAQRLLCAPR